MSAEIIVASTTDTPEQIEAALTHGTEEPVADDTVLSEEEGPDTATAQESPAAATDANVAVAAGEAPAEKKADEKAADKKAEAKNVEKPAEKKQPEPRPQQKDFKGDKAEQDYADALIGWGARHRIGKLTAEKQTERDRAEAAETEATRLRHENDALRAAARTGEEKPADTSAKAEPKADAYETHEEWLAALSKHHAEVAVENATADAKAKATAEASAKDVAETERLFQERRKVADERYPDIAELMAATTVQLNGIEQYVVMTSEVGPDIAYYLAQPEHRAEADRLFALSGPDAIHAMGKLEAKVEQIVDGLRHAAITDAAGESESERDGAGEKEPPPAPKRKVVTNAAEPIDPVGAGRSAGQRKSIYEVESQDEFKRLRNEQITARRKQQRG